MNDTPTNLADCCRTLVNKLLKPDVVYNLLNGETEAPSHAKEEEENVTIADHLLTTSALVYCLSFAYPDDIQEEQRNLLRLAALLHDLPDEKHTELARAYAPQINQEWVAFLRQQGDQLQKSKEKDANPQQYDAMNPNQYDDPCEHVLCLAHLAASYRREVTHRDEFTSHPLFSKAGDKARSVDLVYGGATKIKGYVFESVRLPEIRGASALLDHINRLDLPALWGKFPEITSNDGLTPDQQEYYQSIRDGQQDRYNEVRQCFQAELQQEPLDAPECILYASGGNILALAPAGKGKVLADAIERRYTEVTQVANSVGVSETFSLLELHYGRCPDKFWIDEAEDLLGTSKKDDADTQQKLEAAELLRQSLGMPPMHKGDLSLNRQLFDSKKGFGELVTVLATQSNRRRAGDGTTTGAPRFVPLVGLVSHGVKCDSCGARPAIRQDDGSGHHFCKACDKKRAAGNYAKKGREISRYDEDNYPYKWILPWGTWLEQKCAELGHTVTVEQTPDRLNGISRFSDNFVGLIYADGNDVGKHVASLNTISSYRHFAQDMLDTNEEAVAKALHKHLERLAGHGKNSIWPFEIITIGGDDVLLFVPANKALDIAYDIAIAFDKGMKQTNITLSVGVLLMPDNTPVRFAEKLVDQLLESAKKLAKKPSKHLTKKTQVSTIDFMSLKAVQMVAEDIKTYRRVALERSYLHDENSKQTLLQMTQRPYILDQLKTLLDACAALKRAGFPRSQLYQLRTIISKGYMLQSVVDYLYYITRGKLRSRSARRREQSATTKQSDETQTIAQPDEPYQLFEDKLQQLCGGQKTYPPWRLESTKEMPQKGICYIYDTPLLDIIEIYPFVERERANTPGEGSNT